MPERPVQPHDHTRFSRGGRLTSAAIEGLTTVPPSSGGGSSGGSSGGGVSDHGGLTGLADDDHPQYRLDDSWFDVTRYGATGDGSTDDTSAVNSAIAALVAYGSGTLYFPAGTYKTTAALTALSVPCLVLGDGSAYFDGATDVVSKVTCTSDTAVLFTVTTDTCKFEKLAIVNTHASATAGAGIQVSGGAIGQRCDYQDLVVANFYINVDVQVGAQWAMQKCMVINPVLYALKIRNTVNGDAGDWAISDSAFHTQTRDASAAIRIESSGGGKIVNCKINQSSSGSSFRYNHGIDLAVADSTTILLISNCSFENIDTDAIHATNTASETYKFLVVTGCQFGLYGNNSGRCLNISATAAGDFAVIYFGSNVMHTDGTARAAVTVTNVDRITFGDAVYTGFNALYSATTSTNVVDNSSATGDHGALTGLSDDDHTQYVLRSILTTRGDLFRRGASAIERVALGTSGYVLTSDGTDAVWAVAPSASFGEILISDTPSTPLIFDDLIQNEDQNDLIYADP